MFNQLSRIIAMFRICPNSQAEEEYGKNWNIFPNELHENRMRLFVPLSPNSARVRTRLVSIIGNSSDHNYVLTVHARQFIH